jgi:hypothetical protein
MLTIYMLLKNLFYKIFFKTLFKNSFANRIFILIKLRACNFKRYKKVFTNGKSFYSF